MPMGLLEEGRRETDDRGRDQGVCVWKPDERLERGRGARRWWGKRRQEMDRVG